MKKSQLSRIAKSSIVLCTLLLMGGSMRVYADAPGAHPTYMHAIEYLRQARNVLDVHFSQSNLERARQEAIPKIDQAITNLRDAAQLDEKKVNEIPPPANLDEKGRFHQAAQMLDMAKKNSEGPEADPHAKPLRDKAWKEIDEANAVIKAQFKQP
jgi:hypothetical protein